MPSVEGDLFPHFQLYFSNSVSNPVFLTFRVEPGYNDIGLCVTSSITSHILCYQLILIC